MKHLLAAICIFWGHGLAAENLQITKAGVWHGVGVQIDAIDWPMELTLGETTPTVDYPSLECGGEWQLLKSSGTELLAIEKITYGLDQCLDGGVLRLQKYNDDMLIYHWYDRAGMAVAAAVLMQGKMQEDNYHTLLLLTLEAVGKGFVTGPDGANVTLKDNKI